MVFGRIASAGIGGFVYKPVSFLVGRFRSRVVALPDPSSAALYCVRSGPMEVKDGLNSSKEGEELFKEDRR